MLYVDTSVLVARCTKEAKTADVVKWFELSSYEIYGLLCL